MKKRNLKFSKLKYMLVLTLAIFIIDQISKYWARRGFSGLNLFFLRLAKNEGVGFSILSGHQISIIILNIMIIGSLIYYYFKYLGDDFFLPVSFLLGGALSNLFDRLCCGYVTDFLYTPFWPTFNLADIFIVIGGLIFIWKVRRYPKKKIA